MNVFKKILVFFAFGATFSPAFTATLPHITASIDSTVLTMGSRATITLDVANPSPNGVIINLPEADTETEFVDFISVEADTFPAGLQYKIGIQAFIPGDATFEPFCYVVDNDTFRSSFLSLKVLPVELDSLETINPMESIVNVPRKWYDYIPDYLPWVLLGIAIAGIALALFLIYRKHGTIIIRRPVVIDPYEAAMADLLRLREQKLTEQGKEKEYYTHLVDILRVYLERRFGINAMEMSSTQILRNLNVNPETRDNQPVIKQILEIADFVKFAKVRPLPDDNIKTFNNVVKFVEDTKPQPPEPDEKDRSEKSVQQNS